MVLQASVVLSSSRTKLGIVKKVFLITELCTIESIELSRDARLNLKTGIWLILTEGHEVVSSLPLQMALYFNVLFFPIWFISEVIMLELKYHLLPAYYQYLLISAVTILTITESLRLYLGYIGNLQEKVPELSGFLLLTFLIQMPLILFLLTDEQIVILPLEFAVHTIYIIFLNFELLVSFFALKIMTRQLATQFYLQSTDDLEAKALPSKVKKQQSTDFITEQQKKNALMY